MRIRIRPILLCLLLFLGIRSGPAVYSHVRAAVAALRVSDQPLDNVIRRSSFVIRRDGWTDFELPRNVQRLRITTHACVPKQMADNSIRARVARSDGGDDGWNYSLEFQILNRAGEQQQTGIHNFRSRVRFFQTEASDSDSSTNEPAGTIVPGSRFVDDSILPTAARQLVLDTRSLADARQLRVRLHDADDQISDAVLRLNLRLQRTAAECDRLWRRLRDKDRESLTRGLVHTHELLTAEERRSLLANHWLPLAPAGIENRDFFRRDVLYPRELPTVEFQPRPVTPPVVKRESVTVHVPIQPGILRLRFALGPDVVFPARITTHWFGKEDSPTNSEFYVEKHQLRHDSVFEFARGTEAGSLQLELPAGARLQTFWRPYGATAAAEIELATTANWMSCYRLESEKQPVVFEVSHVDQLATPLRVSLRRAAGSTDVQMVAWTAFANGSPVESGQIELSVSDSGHDFAQDEFPVELTLPEQHFLLLPHAVDRIEFCALDTTVWLAAATRPPDRIPVTRIPEDYSNFERRRSGQRQWFRLRAANHVQQQDAGLLSLVKTHWQPPVAKPDVMAGPHQAIEYRPGPNWLGRHILSPRDADTMFQPRSAAVVYSRIRANTNERVQFVSETESPSTAPALLLLRESDEPTLVSVLVDEQLVATDMVIDRQAMIQLPPLDISRMPQQMIRVETSDKTMQLLLNRTNPQQRESWLRRVANRFQSHHRGGILSFPFEKRSHGDELLTLRLYRARDNQQRTLCRARITGGTASPTARTAWTNRDRLFDLAPSTDAPHVVLNTTEPIDGGQVFFLKAGADLTPGKYTIRIQCSDHSPRYLTMTQLIANPPRWIGVAD